MLSMILKAFGMARLPEDHPLMSRQINLSGNVVHFSMPENFSRDMPAEDMIETVDLHDENVYADYSKFTLIRRWWDFKESGFFGKDYGSLMMSLYVKKASDSLNLTTVEPLDFIDIIVNGIKNDMPANPDPMSFYSDYFAAYSEVEFNGQRWMTYSQGHIHESQLAILYSIPLTKEHYIVVEFVTAPNDDIGTRGFVEKNTQPFIDRIMNSFEIEYLPGNPLQHAVTNQDGPSLRLLIEEKVKRLEALDN